MAMIMAEVYGGTGLGTPRCVCSAGAVVLQCYSAIVQKCNSVIVLQWYSGIVV